MITIILGHDDQLNDCDEKTNKNKTAYIVCTGVDTLNMVNSQDSDKLSHLHSPTRASAVCIIKYGSKERLSPKL